jgi:hypothetical protein
MDTSSLLKLIWPEQESEIVAEPVSREEAYWSHPVCLSLRVETVDLRSRHGAFV